MFRSLCWAFFLAAHSLAAQTFEFGVDLRDGSFCPSEEDCATAPILLVEVLLENDAEGFKANFTATSKNIALMIPVIEARTGMEVLRGPTFRQSGDRFVVDMRLDPHNIINPRDTRVELWTQTREFEGTYQFRERGFISVPGDCPSGSSALGALPTRSALVERLGMQVVIDDVSGFLGVEGDIRDDLAERTTDKVFNLFGNLEILGAQTGGLSVTPVGNTEFTTSFAVWVQFADLPRFFENLGYALGMESGFNLFQIMTDLSDGRTANRPDFQRFMVAVVSDKPYWRLIEGQQSYDCWTDPRPGDGARVPVQRN